MKDLIDIEVPIINEHAVCKFKEKYAKFCEFSTVKFLTIEQIIEMISLLKSFKKRKIRLYQNDLAFTVLNFYSKEALFLFKLIFESKFNVPINRIYIKKIRTGMYKLHIFIFKPYSDSIQNAITTTLQDKQLESFNSYITQESWFIIDLVMCNLKKNNSSSFELSVTKDDIPFIYLNVNLIYIATEYIKIKYNKEVSIVKKESRYNECTYYFEFFPDKTITTLKCICDKVILSLH